MDRLGHYVVQSYCISFYIVRTFLKKNLPGYILILVSNSEYIILTLLKRHFCNVISLREMNVFMKFMKCVMIRYKVRNIFCLSLKLDIMLRKPI